jgi:hypothetical protein
MNGKERRLDSGLNESAAHPIRNQLVLYKYTDNRTNNKISEHSKSSAQNLLLLLPVKLISAFLGSFESLRLALPDFFHWKFYSPFFARALRV